MQGGDAFMDTQEALGLVKRYWQIEGAAHRLPSYIDGNFKIVTTTGNYVFKLAHSGAALSDLEIENAAMLHLANTCQDLLLPQVKPAIDGRHIVHHVTDDEAMHYLRLLTYIDGDMYANVASNKNIDQAKLQHSLGTAVGKLARGLNDFDHENADRFLAWNLSCLPFLADEISAIDDVALRELVARHFSYFNQHLPAWKNNLAMAVIHNDANDYNSIVDVDVDATGAAPVVKSIIDFGDICTSFRVADLAIASTYAMQYAHDDASVIDCITYVLLGYHQQNRLSEHEIEALCPFIMGRLCQSVLMANKAYRQNPDNDYILVSQQGVRRLMKQLDAMNFQEMNAHFFQALST
jgi:Ser/Thr protein kinase RdoA (MazF antagonist)